MPMQTTAVLSRRMMASGNEMDEDEETEASEDDPEPPASEPEQTISAGERVSLRDEAFEPLIYACDNQINNALRVAVETGKGFTFTAKISFEAQSGGLFNISDFLISVMRQATNSIPSK